jgi:hypothetical protein
MNELKDLCDRMVEDAPPMTDSADVLRTARRSAAVHGRLRLAGFGAGIAAAVVVAAVAAVTVQANIHSGRTQRGPAQVAAPGRPEARAHAEKMDDLLAAAVPAGYTVSVSQHAPDDLVVAFITSSGQPVVSSWADASVVVGDAGGRGILQATVWFVDPPGGPCARQNPAAVCEQVTVGGVAVEVYTLTDDAGRHISAVRRFPGGYVSVGAVQAIKHYPNSIGPVVEPGLAVFPFTKDQIVALAANPAMLPPR